MNKSEIEEFKRIAIKYENPLKSKMLLAIYELENAQRENDRYKKALKFYADKNSYVDHVALQDIKPTVLEDGGLKARQVLKEETE